MVFCNVALLVIAMKFTPNRPVRKSEYGITRGEVPHPEQLSDAAVSLAENSRVCPGPNIAVLPTHAPSSVSVPPPTTALPLGGNHFVARMSGGSVDPENSAPNDGARMISPSAVSEMYPPESR